MRSGPMYSAVLAALLLTGWADTAQPAAGPQLPGTSWELTELHQAPPVAGTSITAAFTTEQISGSAGCNRYFGPVALGVGTISVSDALATTLMACDGPVMDQEYAYLAAVRDARAYRLDGDRLTLLDGSGHALAAFVATA
ncbi:META domain-containing protein [Granulicoccus phenolivorans]|uniref:META domain-containing protein n=1 Tax=Granulicoccus phenolivorans TaxID=266854 RepID=UPI00047CD200|nr:META domain-containing protein [Granulicoccus phenolivorans]